MRKLMISFMILCIIFTSACIREETKGIYDLEYSGHNLMFNSNLDEAKNIPVEPDEATLKEALFGYNVAQLKLVNYKNPEEQPYCSKAFISFASKYAKLSLLYWGYDMTDKVSYEMIESGLPNATVEEPAILLLGPAYSNQTHIEVEGNIIKAYGTNLGMRQGKYAQYTDFDLALDRIILILAED